MLAGLRSSRACLVLPAPSVSRHKSRRGLHLLCGDNNLRTRPVVLFFYDVSLVMGMMCAGIVHVTSRNNQPPEYQVVRGEERRGEERRGEERGGEEKRGEEGRGEERRREGDENMTRRRRGKRCVLD
eukprot:221943-Hanusia_phi.AAC.1